jgi:hypothetical protein
VASLSTARTALVMVLTQWPQVISLTSKVIIRNSDWFGVDSLSSFLQQEGQAPVFNNPAVNACNCHTALHSHDGKLEDPRQTSTTYTGTP